MKIASVVLPWNVWLAVVVVFAVLLLLPVWLVTGPRRQRRGP